MMLALVISSLGGGGGERIMLDLARGWLARARRAAAPPAGPGVMAPTPPLAHPAARGPAARVLVYELVDPGMEQVGVAYSWLRRVT